MANVRSAADRAPVSLLAHCALIWVSSEASFVAYSRLSASHPGRRHRNPYIPSPGSLRPRTPSRFNSQEATQLNTSILPNSNGPPRSNPPNLLILRSSGRNILAHINHTTATDLMPKHKVKDLLKGHLPCHPRHRLLRLRINGRRHGHNSRRLCIRPPHILRMVELCVTWLFLSLT